MNKETNQIEDIFREAFENYEVDAGSNAWQAIQSKMAAESAAASSASAASTTTAATSSSWVATAIVATVISATAIGGYFFFNDTAGKIKGKEQKAIINEQADLSGENTTEIQKENTVVPEKEVSEAQSADKAVENNINSEKESENSRAQLPPTNSEGEVIEKDKHAKANKESQSGEQNVNKTEGTATVQNNQSESQVTNDQTGPVNETNEVVKEDNSSVSQNEEPTPSKSMSPSTNSTEDATEKSIAAPVFDMPNVFSPNQDGINDEFVVEVDQFDNIEVKIFSKTNRLVFETNKPNNFWNGNLPNGSAASEGYYFYRIIVEKEGKAFSKTGGVSLTR